MPIEFRCTACNKLLRVPDGSAGKRAKCPDCETVLSIPEASQPPVPGSLQPGAPPPQPSHQAPPQQPSYSAPPLMSENPFESPHAEQSYAYLTDSQIAAKVSAPATCLMVAGGISLVIQIFSLALVLFMGAGAFGGDFQAGNGVPGLEFLASTAWGIFSSLLSLARCGVLIFGAMQMKKLQSYPLALTVSIIAIVPCFSGCCLLELPFGIWATVILCQADVKAAFDRAVEGY